MSALRNANNPKTIAAFRRHLRCQNPPKFQPGDLVDFEKERGRKWPLMILGIRGNDVDVICYDGNPHLLRLKVATLGALRITKVEASTDETVAMYRALVGLDIEGEPA
ncbi:hypothetical protein [Shinella granuli]|jgi:hypothetical protein|uniref:Uncharacterized protein n=1 Tax=Shinella granuli TaxID=323621 RepID=A0A4R2BZY5_SHIGR|nr:hypothetical protein [Shinella granuli]TCN33511.1 hypothetical protein EV665_14126 [Shinella granuli]